MKEKWNFKKLLASIGLLTLVVPSSLSVAACKSNQTSLLLVPDAFKDFSLKDQKNVQTFADSNDLNSITKQIEEHIQNFLEPAGLVLENLTSNSVVVKAKTDSKKYQGEITLSWNLKLFEIWGTEVENAIDSDVRNGLKGYFYLDGQDKQIKFFDVIGYKNIDNIIVDDNTKDETHKFYFVNQSSLNKEFSIYGHNLTQELPTLFGNFNFTTGVEITLDSKEPKYIRIFDKKTNQWNNSSKKEYSIDNSGNII